MFKRYVYIEGLTNLYGSGGKYLINNEGQIKDIKGNDVLFHRDEDGQKVVNCLGWDGERNYRVIDLVAIQFKELRLPIKFFNLIRGFCIDGDNNNTHARNVGYRFLGGRIEVEEFPGFYYVPSVPNAAISEAGQLINLNTGNKRNWDKMSPNEKKNIKGGYYLTNLLFTRNKTMAVTRHRCLCLAFKEYPNNVDSLVVNHIDGVGGNDWLGNLEWVTRGYNNKNAYETGLRGQNLKVLIRNARNGEVREYYSLTECARKMGFKSEESIRNRIYNSPFGKIFSDGYQIKLKEDDREWVFFDDVEKEIRKARTHLPIISRNCRTLEEHNHPTISSASLLTEIEESSISYRLSVDNRGPMFGYQFKFEDDQRPFPNFSKIQYENSLRVGSYTVDAKNLLTNENKNFPSIKAAEVAFKNSWISSIFRKGGQPLLESGWQLKKSFQVWEEIKDFEEEIYKQKRTIVARKEENGSVVIADNAAQLATLLGCDPKSIRKAAFTRGNKIYKGYRFRLGVSSEPWPVTVCEQ